MKSFSSPLEPQVPAVRRGAVGDLLALGRHQRPAPPRAARPPTDRWRPPPPSRSSSSGVSDRPEATEPTSALHEATGGELVVDGGKRLGRRAPGVAAGPPHGRRVARRSASAVVDDPDAPLGEGLRRRGLDQVARSRRGRRGWSARRRRGHDRRAAGRGLEGHQAEGLRAARARGRRRRPGSSVESSSWGCGATMRPARRRRPARSASARARPRYARVALGPARAARRPRACASASADRSSASVRTATSAPLSGWIRPTNEQERRRRSGSPSARRAWGRSPGPKKAWSTPGATTRTRRGSAP